MTCFLLGLLAWQPACASREVSLGTVNNDAGAEAGASTAWIATVAGPGDQTVSAVAFGSNDEVFVAGQQPGSNPNEAATDVFVGAFARPTGAARWLVPMPGRDFGWEDDVAALFNTSTNGVAVGGTYRVGAEDAIGFWDSLASPGVVTSAAAPFNTACVPGQICDATLSYELLAAAPAANDLAVAGILHARAPAPPPWLLEPVALDLIGWGFVGVVRNGLPVWARSQGDRFIRFVSSVAWQPDGLLVAAAGSDSATSDDADRPPWLWLLKFNSLGEVVLARAFRSSEGLVQPRLVLTSAGPVVVGGYSGRFAVDGIATLITPRPQDTFVLALNQDLSPRWLQSLGGDEFGEGGHGVAVTGAGDLVVACGTCALDSPDDDPGVPGLVRLGPDGQRKSLQRWSTTGAVRVNAMAAQGNEIIVGGNFTKQLSVGPGQQATAIDSLDGFVLHVAQP